MAKTLLQINTVVNSGSTGRIAEEIGQTAMATGWQSVIAYGRNPRPSASELIRIGRNWDVRLHGLRSRIFDDHSFGSRKATEVPYSSQVHKVGDVIFDRSRDGDFQLRTSEQVRQLYLRKSDTFSENKIYPYVTLSDLDE